MPAVRIGATDSIIVRTVTGLEQLAAGELTEAGHRVIDTSKRQLVIEPTSTTILTSPPRLADDLFLIEAAVPDPGHTKAAMAAAVGTLSIPPDDGDFAVSASFHGRRNYNRFDVEDLVGELIGARYHSRRTGVVPASDRTDWRVILDGKTMWVGRRPFDVPLHRRAWRRRTVTGSLHPPVAAAMARLAEIAAGHRVLDPFCGAGTLLLEAQSLEPQATYVGIDHHPTAIAAARANSEHPITWQVGAAERLQGSFDRILTNPPWGVRLHLDDFKSYLAQWRRVLRPGGLVVAILNQSQAARLTANPAWYVHAQYDVSVAGQHPRILVAEPRR